MKKYNLKFYITALLIVIFSSFYSQTFQSGNLVVCRVGNGSTAIGSAGAAVSLVEMTTGGSTAGLMTANLPTAVSGSNRILTQSGSASSEGEVTLSADGRYLVCVGYDAVPGTASIASSTVNGTIGRVDSSGTTNSTTYFTRTSGFAYNANNLRAACTKDGSAFWGSGTGGATGGVRYITLGTAGGAGTLVSNTITNTRITNIFNNQLYASSQTGAFSLSTVGIGLPATTGNIITNLSGVAAGTDDTYSYVFFDVNGNGTPDLLYYVSFNGISTGNSGIYKYSSADEGATWIGRGKLQGTSGNFPRGIAGRKNCSGTFDLYFTMGATSARPTKVWSYTDNANYNANITSNGSNITAVASNIYTVGANYALGGIAFAPTQGDLIINSGISASGNYRTITVNSGTLTLSGNIAVSDTIFVANGATLDCGNFNVYGLKFILASGATLKIGSVNGITASSSLGNIQTGCRSYSTNANYEYKGSASQVTGDGLPAAVNNLTINNSTGVSLTNPVTVSGIASFTSGLLTTTSTNLLIVSSTGSVTGVCNSSFVNGPVRKIGNAAFVFPTGKGAQYAPVSITAPSLITDHFTAEYFNSDPDPTYSNTLKDLTIDHISLCEYWILDRTNGTSNVSVTLSWDSPRSCGVTALTDLTVAHWDLSLATPMWKDMGNGSTTGTTTTGTLTTLSAVSSFSPFTLASISTFNPLPIELLNFAAKYNGKDAVDLSWQTATETNNNFFTIERSKDGVNFEQIAGLNGAGNSTHTINYSIKDNSPLAGISYYRLKQTDYDGKYKYSEVVSINIFESFNVKNIFPNPAADKLTIDFDDQAIQQVQVKIIDCTGRQIYFVKKDIESNFTIDLSEFSSGMYLIIIDEAGKQYQQKFIKQ